MSFVEATIPEDVCWCVVRPGAATSVGVAADAGPTSHVCTCLSAFGATTGKRTEGVCWCLARPGAATPDAAARKCRCQEDVRATTSTQDKKPEELNHDPVRRTHDVRLLAKSTERPAGASI